MIKLFAGIVTPTTDVQNPVENTSSSAENQTDGSEQELDQELDQELRRAFLFKEILWGKLDEENVTDLKDMGHRFEDLVFECNFRGA